MSDFETAARPYAKAIFELADGEGKLQAWQDNLELAASVAGDRNMAVPRGKCQLQGALLSVLHRSESGSSKRTLRSPPRFDG